MSIYDAIVVGGGPAGSSAAEVMARSGLAVLLLEKEKMPRYKCCAGGIPRKVSVLLDLDPASCGAAPVRGLVVSWQGSRPRAVTENRPLGWVVKREDFDYLLLRRAETAGADVREGCGFIGLETDRDITQVTTTEGTFRGRTLIGADGARSRVGSLLGADRLMRFGFALETRLAPSPDIIEKKKGMLFVDLGAVPGGYGWIFPFRDGLNVGVATRRVSFRKLRGCLRDYLRREGLTEELPPGAVRGSALAFNLLPFGIVKGNCLLAGDAAGLTDRLTGEGIYQAIVSGQLAARAITAYLSGHAPLASYRTMVRKTLGVNLLIASGLSRLTGLFPRKMFAVAHRDDVRIRKAMAVVQGELSYRDLFKIN